MTAAEANQESVEGDIIIMTGEEYFENWKIIHKEGCEDDPVHCAFMTGVGVGKNLATWDAYDVLQGILVGVEPPEEPPKLPNFPDYFPPRPPTIGLN